MPGYKQEGLAIEPGDDQTQKRVSALEQKEAIDDKLLEQVAAIFKVPIEAIRNFDAEVAVNIIATTINSHDNSFAHSCTFNVNPIDKWIETVKENKQLYERLLSTEREKVALLEKSPDKK